MKKIRSVLLPLLAVLLLGSCLMAAGVAALRLRSWVGRTFPGFLVYDQGIIFPLMFPSWSGSRAGLEFMDRLESYDGRPYASSGEMYEYVSQFAPGQPVGYIVRRGDMTLMVVVSTEQFKRADALRLAVAAPIQAAVFAIWLFVVCAIRRAGGRALLAVFCGVPAILWGALIPEYFMGGRCAAILQLSGVLIAPGLVTFLYFHPKERKLGSPRAIALVILHLLALALFGGYLLSYSDPERFILVEGIAWGVAAFEVLLAVILLLDAFVNPGGAGVRRQAKILLAGAGAMGVCFFAAVVFTFVWGANAIALVVVGPGVCLATCGYSVLTFPGTGAPSGRSAYLCPGGQGTTQCGPARKAGQ